MVEPEERTSTDQEEISEEARPLKSPPDPEAIDEPVRDSEQEARETAWFMKETTSIGVISILLALLLALALMQATGLVDLLSPIAGTEFSQWIVFGVLLVVVVAIFLWSRRGM